MSRVTVGRLQGWLERIAPELPVYVEHPTEVMDVAVQTMEVGLVYPEGGEPVKAVVLRFAAPPSER